MRTRFERRRFPSLLKQGSPLGANSVAGNHASTRSRWRRRAFPIFELSSRHSPGSITRRHRRHLRRHCLGNQGLSIDFQGSVDSPKNAKDPSTQEGSFISAGVRTNPAARCPHARGRGHRDPDPGQPARNAGSSCATLPNPAAGARAGRGRFQTVVFADGQARWADRHGRSGSGCRGRDRNRPQNKKADLRFATVAPGFPGYRRSAS